MGYIQLPPDHIDASEGGFGSGERARLGGTVQARSEPTIRMIRSFAEQEQEDLRRRRSRNSSSDCFRYPRSCCAALRHPSGPRSLR